MSDRPCPICGAALAPGQVIDRGCAARTRTYLREVPAALAELDLAISRQASMPPAAGTGGCPDGCRHGDDDPACVAGVQVDLDIRASEASLALRTTLHGWARVWDEETAHPAPLATDEREALWRVLLMRSDRERLMGTAQGQAGLLAAVPLAGRAWAAELARDVADAVEEAWRAVDRPPDTRIVGRCPVCSCALYAPEDAPMVRCRWCGRTYVCADVREQSLIESRHLLPVVQLAIAIGANERTVRSWVSRDRLIRVRYGLDGKPLYRVSDAAALKAAGVEVTEEESA